jgi:ABC-type transporter Mla subunit MlaD
MAMDKSRISISDIREVIRNLEYLVGVSADRSEAKRNYTQQLEDFNERLDAATVEVPSMLTELIDLLNRRGHRRTG